MHACRKALILTEVLLRGEILQLGLCVEFGPQWVEAGKRRIRLTAELMSAAHRSTERAL